MKICSGWPAFFALLLRVGGGSRASGGGLDFFSVDENARLVHHDDGAVGHVGDDYAAGADTHVVADVDGPDDFCAGPDKDVIAEDGRATPPR